VIKYYSLCYLGVWGLKWKSFKVAGTKMTIIGKLAMNADQSIYS